MASAKQIAANRANAQRSTGPKTAWGKIKSSRNSFRHGLSWPLALDLATSSTVDALAQALTPRDAGDAEWASAVEFAFIAPMITRNSPTKPLVAGSPAFAMAKSIISEANFGMVFTTPP